MKRIVFSLAFFMILSISALASQPVVVDAVNYEKTVVTADYALEMGFKQGDFGSHAVIIPKINLDTPTVQKINKEMYEIASGVYERLLNDQEYNQIYNYGYFYKEEGGVIGIVVTENRAVQCGGGNSEYKAFYYDKRTDKQLSFKQYLSALGVNIKDLSNNSKIVREYENAGQPDEPVILDAILDSKSSIVYVKTPMSMNSSMVVESSTALVKIHLNNPFELYVGKADEIVMTLGNKTAYVSGNAVQIDAEPIISNGRTMLPARFVAEKLGASVDWDASSRKVTIQKGTLKIELVVGSSIAYVNNREVTLDSPVFIQDGRTYTPVRFVAERLGAVVEWMSATKQVVISTEVSIEDILTEFYYDDNGDNLGELSSMHDRAFLADLDFDCIPELCLSWGDGGYNSWLWIYKYKNGKIEKTNSIACGGGTGISSGFDLILQDNGEILICKEHSVWSFFSDSMVEFSYNEYSWTEVKDIEKYSIHLSKTQDHIISCVENGIESLKPEKDLQSLLDATYLRIKNNAGKRIVWERITFNSVWKQQEQLYKS